MRGARPGSSSAVLSEHGRESGVECAGPRQVPRPPIEEILSSLAIEKTGWSWMTAYLLEDAAAEDFSSIRVLEEHI